MTGTWRVRASLTHPGVAAPLAPAEAVVAVQAALAAALPEWSVEDLHLRPVFAVGEWVAAEKQGNRTEFARVVEDQKGGLQIEFADGTRRALRPDAVARV